jgi:hypothetical protein
MKQLLLTTLLFTSLFNFAQVTGKIMVDGRTITQDIPYLMDMNKAGILVFNIAVDVKGNVTSCKLNKLESTIKNTVYAYRAKNLILMELKFEKGNGYPTFHQGLVTISARIPD